LIRLYHITHIDNLAQIIADGCLFSDRILLKQHKNHTVIGMSHIKRRRLEKIEVSCHPGTKVGDYVPFYFCPRSVMLYVIYRGHSELSYMGGQENILHLVTTVETILKTNPEKWAYSDGNAGAFYTKFYNDLDKIDKILNWEAINARDWRDPGIKEAKQAEFLVYEKVPWKVFTAIGVHNEGIYKKVLKILKTANHKPDVLIKPEWYY
jgi:hypothetical protein